MYIPYYRVSTKTQGLSGLGLEAQKKSVLNYIGEGNILSEFTEIESGRKNDRQQLQNAIDMCIDNEATLVIAKLDRLSRNASFILSLFESKVKFVAVDMPNANELTVGIMSIIAQDEAKRISERTIAALQIKSEQLALVGKRLGTPANLTDDARLKSVIVRKEKAKNNSNNKKAYALISVCSGSFRSIAILLNDGDFKTSTGCNFTPMAVSRIKRLYEKR